MKQWTQILACVLGMWMADAGSKAVGAANYETGYASIERLSVDLYKALEPEERRSLHPVPVLVQNMKAPYLQPSKHFNGSNMVAAVYISSGFVDMVNSLSHAMAINGTERGFLKQYLQRLARAESAVEVQPVANRDNDDIKNYQISNFNQISSGLVAMDMAHHYLGHYRKYASQLGEKQTIPINTVVTPDEWRRAVLHGAQNALNCGLGVEGLQYLFESLGDMPSRPAWAGYFMPEQVNVGKLKRDLTRLQDCFFAGKKFKF